MQLVRGTGNTGPSDKKKRKKKKDHLHFSLHAAKAPAISHNIISAAYVFCRLMHRIHFLLEETILP